MKHILTSLLMIAVGAFGLLNGDAMRELYDSLHPASPARAQALDFCANIGLNFDKLDEAQRQACNAGLHRPVPAIQVSSPITR